MRILVVDDELVSRSKLQKILEKYGNVDACEDGAAAIEAFKKALEEGTPYGLLTLDVMMPVLDGMQALQAIRDFEKERNLPKRTPVFIVTSRSDKETVISSVRAGCDGIVVKPFDSELISRKLKNLGIGGEEASEAGEEAWQETMRRAVVSIIERFKRNEIELPVLPNVVQEVERVIAEPESTVSDLSHVIEKDAVTSAKLIAVANSPIYRSLGKIQSVGQAIARLGFKETQKIIMAIATKSLYKTKSKPLQEVMEKQRLYSLASAHASSQIAASLGFLDTEKFFLMGLVNDIGNVLLLWMVGGMKIENAPVDMNEVVLELQKLHCSFGALLLDKWRFPDDFIDVAREHEGPEFPYGTAKEILIANLAGHVAFSLGYGFYKREDVELAKLEAVRQLKIAPEALEEIGKAVKELVEHSSELL